MVTDMDEHYNNRELDKSFGVIDGKLDQLVEQTTKTNGRVTRLERSLLVVGSATIAILALKFPEILGAFSAVL